MLPVLDHIYCDAPRGAAYRVLVPTNSAEARRRRLQLISLVVFIVVFVIGAVVRARGNSAGTVLMEIAAALVIVAIILVVFRQFLGKNADTLVEIRRTDPVSYLCYLENGKRGVVSVHNGELVIRRFKGRQLVDFAQIPAGGYALSPATVQLAPARRADGIAISPAGAAGTAGTVRIALSQDKMTLAGSTLKAADLDRAMTALQNAHR